MGYGGRSGRSKSGSTYWIAHKEKAESIALLPAGSRLSLCTPVQFKLAKRWFDAELWCTSRLDLTSANDGEMVP